MRSAGCIFNDIVDKDFDKKKLIEQKKTNCIKKITINQSFIYVAFLCGLAFFNFNTI